MDVANPKRSKISLSEFIPFGNCMKLHLPQLLLDSNSDEQTLIPNNIHLFQFNDIQNAKDLLKIIKTSDSEFPNCTILDRSAILSLFQIQIACTKAYLNSKQSAMRTRSIYTEILLSLSHTSSISDCFKNFGLGPKTKDIFIIIDVQDSELENVGLLFEKHIHGTQVDVEFKFDEQKIAKVFLFLLDLWNQKPQF